MLGFLSYIFVTIVVIIFILVLIYYCHNNYITFSSMFITIFFVGIFALIVLISDYSTEKKYFNSQKFGYKKSL